MVRNRRGHTISQDTVQMGHYDRKDAPNVSTQLLGYACDMSVRGYGQFETLRILT